VGVASVVVFAASQAAKLVVAEKPLDYLRTHRLDFSVFFVLAVQVAVHVSLRASPEYEYLARRGAPSPLWPFHVAVIQAYVVAIVLLQSHRVHAVLVGLRLRPAQALVVSFAALVAVGAALLALPGASRDGRSAGWVDALFTATSAVCVTGLAIRDTGTELSSAGQTVLLGLIQAGGLGMLTITTFVAVFGRGRLPRGQARALPAVLNVETERQMRRTLRQIAVATLSIEALGAFALYALWGSALADPFERAAWAVFHSVSAFCNAGFALFPRHASLTAFAENPGTLAVVGTLIVAGGLGFGVLSELGGRIVAALRRSPTRPLSPHTRWVLAPTAFLLVLGAAAFLAAEGSGALSTVDHRARWINAAFQSVTLRTAGFNSVDLSALGIPAFMLCVAWMLVGGSPSSTAGGMKTTTAALSLASLVGRRVPSELAGRARRLAAAYLGVYVASSLLLALAQGEWSRRIAFEAASALGTVGLSMGLTAELGDLSKLLLCATMFVGRVGPFALVAAVAGETDSAAREDESRILLS
jgi:trk system potassium uptake protein TrkH